MSFNLSKVIRGSRKKKSANLEKIRLKSHVNEPKSTKQTAQQQQQLQQKKQQKTDSLTSATNTDRLSLSGQSIESVNDTLLLVTNEIVKTHASPPKKKTKRQKHDLEIVSFEVIKLVILILLFYYYYLNTQNSIGNQITIIE